MTEKQYEKLVDEMSPKSPMGRDCLNAFWIGGLICVIGQVFMNCYTNWGLDKEAAGTATSMSLVTLSALLTGLSLYDDIAKHAGAGTLVPITGFANSIAAPAVEFKTDECDIIGLSRKAFISGEYDDLVQKSIFSKGGAYIQRWEHPKLLQSIRYQQLSACHTGYDTERFLSHRSVSFLFSQI